MVYTLVTPLRYGITNYIMRKFDPELFPAFISKYRITETVTAPPMISSLLSRPHCHTREQLKTLRTVFCGGAALSISLQKSFETDVLDPEARVNIIWGMTECSWTSRFYYPEHDDSGSVGRLIPNNEARYARSLASMF